MLSNSGKTSSKSFNLLHAVHNLLQVVDNILQNVILLMDFAPKIWVLYFTCFPAPIGQQCDASTKENAVQGKAQDCTSVQAVYGAGLGTLECDPAVPGLLGRTAPAWRLRGSRRPGHRSPHSSAASLAGCRQQPADKQHNPSKPSRAVISRATGGTGKALILRRLVHEGGTSQIRTCLAVEVTHPLQKTLHCGIPPHPGGKALHQTDTCYGPLISPAKKRAGA